MKSTSMRPFILLGLIMLNILVIAPSYVLGALSSSVKIIDNHSLYHDANARLYVVGEVENTGSTFVDYVFVNVTFYDSQGTVLPPIHGAGVYTWLDTIPPNVRTGFKIDTQSTPETIGKIHHYNLNVRAYEREATANRHDVWILSSLEATYNKDSDRLVWTSFWAENGGSWTAKNTKVIVTCYDSSDKVVLSGVDSSWYFISIEPGKKKYLTNYFVDKEQGAKAQKYKVQIKSDYPTSNEIALTASAIMPITNPATTPPSTTPPPTTPTPSPTPTPQQRTGCLIASALYGSPYEPEVKFLRNFRDDKLVRIAGRPFVNDLNTWYYSFSPEVAQYIQENSWVRLPMILLISPVVSLLHTADVIIELLTD